VTTIVNLRSFAGRRHWLPASVLALLAACSGDEVSVTRPDDSKGGAPTGVPEPSDAGAGTGAAAGSSAASGGQAPIGLGGRTSSSGGAAGGDGSAGDDGTGGKSCGTTRLDAEQPLANVLLVIDKSSSMENQGGFSESKWLTLSTALRTAIVETRARVSYGLEFFPFAQDPDDEPETCETPASGGPLVAITDTTGADAVLTALDEYQPAGGTPTAAALERAGEYFAEGDGAQLTGDKYVLLATDGGPNCNAEQRCEADTCTINLEGFDCSGNCCDPDKDPEGPTSCLDEEGTLAAVEALAEAGVKTFVVGIPGTEFYAETLDRIAIAGLAPNESGESKYYRVSADGDAEGLTALLVRITSGVIRTCSLQLEEDPPALDKINVEIDGDVIPQQGDDGWEIDESTSPATLVLKGETCRVLESEGAASIEVTFGCPTVVQIF
jgi:hypothetical protein